MILLLSGFAGLSASLIPMQLALGHRLRRPVTRANVGLGLGCIRAAAECAAAEVELAARACGERVDLVGYSMGGLVATYLLKCLDRGARVRSVVTLGSPHLGSPAIRAGRGFLELVSAPLAQMAPGSAFLDELRAAEVPEGCRLVSVASWGDVWVPPLYAELPAAPRQHNRVLSGASHFGLLVSREALRAVEQSLGVYDERRDRLRDSLQQARG